MPSSLFRSLVFNWFGLVLSAIIGLLISPFVVRTLGKEQYGLFALIVSITSQFILLDVGTRHALVKYVASYYAEKDFRKLSSLISTAAIFLTFLVGIGTIIIFILYAHLNDWFQISPQYIFTAKLLLVILAIDAALDLIFGVFGATLGGFERYDILNSLNVTRLIIASLLTVLFLSLGFGVLSVAIISLLAKSGQRFGHFYFVRREAPEIQISVQSVSLSTMKSMARYGFWAFALAIAGRLIYQTDSLVVGIFIGTIGVATYAIPAMLVEQVRSLTTTAGTILTSRLSALTSASNSEAAQSLALKWATLSQIGSLALCLPILVTGDDFLRLWMGQGFEDSELILKLLIVPFLLTIPAFTITSYLFAIGEHKVAAKLQLAEAGANLILSILLVKAIGLAGVAIGTLLPATIFGGVLLPSRAASRCGITPQTYFKVTIIRCLPLAALHLLFLLLLQYLLGAQSWLLFLLNNTIGFLTIITITYIFFMDSDDRAYIKRRLGLN